MVYVAIILAPALEAISPAASPVTPCSIILPTASSNAYKPRPALNCVPESA